MSGPVVLPDMGDAQLARRVVASINAIARRGRICGYNFWLNKLNQLGGNYLDAEMIKAFITSFEYRTRFGQ